MAHHFMAGDAMFCPEKQHQAAKVFAERWKDKESQKSDTHSFWLSLLRDVYDVEKPEEYIEFEKPVKIKILTCTWVTEKSILVKMCLLRRFLRAFGLKMFKAPSPQILPLRAG